MCYPQFSSKYKLASSQQHNSRYWPAAACDVCFQQSQFASQSKRRKTLTGGGHCLDILLTVPLVVVTLKQWDGLHQSKFGSYAHTRGYDKVYSSNNKAFWGK